LQHLAPSAWLVNYNRPEFIPLVVSIPQRNGILQASTSPAVLELAFTRAPPISELYDALVHYTRVEIVARGLFPPPTLQAMLGSVNPLHPWYWGTNTNTDYSWEELVEGLRKSTQW
jgi:hypothetical protein